MLNQTRSIWSRVVALADDLRVKLFDSLGGTRCGRKRPACRTPRSRLGLEALEDRLAPAHYLWVAPLAGTRWWSDADNWVDVNTGQKGVPGLNNTIDVAEFNAGKVAVGGKIGVNFECAINLTTTLNGQNLNYLSLTQFIVAPTYANEIEFENNVIVTELFDYKPANNPLSKLVSSAPLGVAKLTVQAPQNGAATANINYAWSHVNLEFSSGVTTTLDSANDKYFLGTVSNYGTFQMKGSGDVYLAGDFTNQDTGKLEIQNDTKIGTALANPTFVNIGTMTKAVGAGVALAGQFTEVGVNFENRGQFNVDRGSVKFLKDAKQTRATATTKIERWGELIPVPSAYLIDAGEFVGAGRVSGSLENKGGLVRAYDGNSIVVTGTYKQWTAAKLFVRLHNRSYSVLSVGNLDLENNTKFIFDRGNNHTESIATGPFLKWTGTLNSQAISWETNGPNEKWRSGLDGNVYKVGAPAIIPNAKEFRPTFVLQAEPKGALWLDTNQDGIRNAGELPLRGVTVSLFDDEDNLIATTTTDPSGEYSFVPPDAGDYYVSFDVPTGHDLTDQDQGSDDSIDSDANVSTGKTAVFTYDPEGSDIVLDAGFLITAPLVSWVGGGSGDWDTGSNWSGGVVPTSSDTVFIPSGSTVSISSSTTAGSLLVAGTLNLSSDLTLQGQALINNLNLSGGNIYDGEVTVTSTFNWTGGNINGGLGDFTIAPGATATLDSSSSSLWVVMGRKIVNYGTATWATAGTIQLNSSTWENMTGATFVFDAPSGQTLSGGSPGDLLNHGTIIKTGTGTTTFDGITLTNHGTVDVQAGGLSLIGGSSDGVFSLASATQIDFTGAYTLDEDSVVLGDGTLLVSEDELTIDGFVDGVALEVGSLGSVAVNSDSIFSSLDLAGQLSGSGNVTVTDDFDLTGSSLSGSGSLTIDGTASATLSGTVLVGRDVYNYGDLVWTPSGDLQLDAAWYNLSGSTFEADVSSATQITGTGEFINEGTFTKTGSGTLTFDSIALSNAGAIDIQAGTLVLAGGSSEGSIATASGTTLQFADDFTLESTSTITGSGSLSLSSGTLTLAGSITASSFTIASGATVIGAGTINADVQNDGTLIVGLSGADTLSINGDFTQGSTGTLEMDIGGTTAGSDYDQLQITGSASLDGTLSVEYLNGFTPATSDTFELLTFGSLGGTFSSIIDSLSLTPQYNSADFSLLA